VAGFGRHARPRRPIVADGTTQNYLLLFPAPPAAFGVRLILPCP
jgi:hypothetical protein